MYGIKVSAPGHARGFASGDSASSAAEKGAVCDAATCPMVFFDEDYTPSNRHKTLFVIRRYQGEWRAWPYRYKTHALPHANELRRKFFR